MAGWFPDGWNAEWWQDEWWPEYGIYGAAIAGEVEVSYNMPDVEIETGEMTTETTVSIGEVTIQVVMTE